MKRYIYILLALVVLPWVAAAQVDTSVEVTKEYRPTVERAAKLALEPDMTDTVRIYPEIDYTITPLSIETSLKTRPIAPAKLTYWDFNRSLPFYIKAGAGYPANSLVDFYASTHNAERGYIVGAVNHSGDYAKMRNDMGLRTAAWEMHNRASVSAGKYFLRHVVEGGISYENSLFHRYGEVLSAGVDAPRINYGDARFNIRVGDEFHDLSRLNFEVGVHGGLFDGLLEAAPDGREMSIGAVARIARYIGRSAHHRFSVEAAYEHSFGARALDGREQGQVMVGARYGGDGGSWLFEVGADFYHDHVRRGDGSKAVNGDYLIPYLRLEMDLGTKALRPYLAIDGEVRDMDYRALALDNPYLAQPRWGDKSCAVYRGRIGVSGIAERQRLSYGLYAEFEVRDNTPFWYSMSDVATAQGVAVAGALDFVQARQTVTSINLDGEFRPMPEFLLALDLRVNIANNESGGYHLYPDRRTELEGAVPLFEGAFRARYGHRRFEVGLTLDMASSRSWTTVARRGASSGLYDISTFESPFAVDLGVDVVWKLSHRLHLFAEGRNLADSDLYDHPWYRRRGAQFVAGVKLNF